MQKIIVNSNQNGKKLITLITSRFPNLKISDLRKALRKKDIKINGKRTNKDEILNTDDIIEIYITDDSLYGKVEEEQFKIIYEDENIVVVDKGKNLEVTGNNSLTEILQKQFYYIEPCHRIDRNTVGLVVFAKNEKTLQYIRDKFKNGYIEKHYIAHCYGIPQKDEEELEAYLFKDRKKARVYISDKPKKGYVKIKTSYKVISEDLLKNISILDVTLHTGRTHQIRAHLAYIGLPILGDGKYGIYDINKKYKMNSQQLCSYSIKFINFTDEFEYLNNKIIERR